MSMDCVRHIKLVYMILIHQPLGLVRLFFFSKRRIIQSEWGQMLHEPELHSFHCYHCHWETNDECSWTRFHVECSFISFYFSILFFYLLGSGQNNKILHSIRQNDKNKSKWSKNESHQTIHKTIVNKEEINLYHYIYIYSVYINMDERVECTKWFCETVENKTWKSKSHEWACRNLCRTSCTSCALFQFSKRNWLSLRLSP